VSVLTNQIVIIFIVVIVVFVIVVVKRGQFQRGFVPYQKRLLLMFLMFLIMLFILLLSNLVLHFHIIVGILIRRACLCRFGLLYLCISILFDYLTLILLISYPCLR